MLKQKSGNVVSITAALADQPVAAINASVLMITKGGLNTVTRSLAIEGNRFDAVPPAVEHIIAQGCSQGISYGKTASEDDYGGKRLCRRSLYLSRAGQVTGEIIHVDGGSHAGCS
jgi:hypothetical protein